MLDTLTVSRDALFSLRCNLEYNLNDLRRTAQVAIQYQDHFTYWTAQEGYEDTLRMLNSPVFDTWNKDSYAPFPTWTEYMLNCDDDGKIIGDDGEVIVFTDGSTIDDTADVPF